MLLESTKPETCNQTSVLIWCTLGIPCARILTVFAQGRLHLWQLRRIETYAQSLSPQPCDGSPVTETLHLSVVYGLSMVWSSLVSGLSHCGCELESYGALPAASVCDSRNFQPSQGLGFRVFGPTSRQFMQI